MVFLISTQPHLSSELYNTSHITHHISYPLQFSPPQPTTAASPPHTHTPPSPQASRWTRWNIRPSFSQHYQLFLKGAVLCGGKANEATAFKRHSNDYILGLTFTGRPEGVAATLVDTPGILLPVANAQMRK